MSKISKAKNISQYNPNQAELKVLKFWQEKEIFKKTLSKNKEGKKFVFYEGPPTANAAPGIHHVEARVFKDVIPRYKSMRGFFVPRRAGWDTHGLPVELQIEKKLGFKNKSDIEKFGIGKFNEEAKNLVWNFKEDWDKLTQRIGYWVDLENPYITYEAPYMESLWFIIKTVWEKGFLMEDFKVLPWCPRCETGLSYHELGQPGAYKIIKDNSVFVKFKIHGRDNEYLLVWTTTPWTLPANVAIAVNPGIEYKKFKLGNEFFWAAKLPEKFGSAEQVAKVKGEKLLGLKYDSLFKIEKPEYLPHGQAPYEVIAVGFVSTEEGTGLVHLAPAFGEDDLKAVKDKWGDLYPIIQTVSLQGKMKSDFPGGGKNIREANADIIENLKKRDLLFFLLPYEHEYPHCWRCDTPLIYFAKTSWWIRMGKLKKQMLENNKKINWIPENLKNGRFGEFLKEIRDWAFSRDRYWGTPLPIWRCEGCKNEIAVGGRHELALKGVRSQSNYFVMRHGEAVSNVKNIVERDGVFPLTPKGQKEVAASIRAFFKNSKPDIIVASPVMRTKQTAEIAAAILGVGKIKFDSRLQEINTGIFNGRPNKDYHRYFGSLREVFTKRPPQGENLTDVRSRVAKFINDLESEHAGKKILIISHEYPIWSLFQSCLGLNDAEAIELRGNKDDFINLAQIMHLERKNIPRDETGAVNLHRPYVDIFEFACEKCGKSMKRVSAVADVWFDSGSMPFAQNNWPFEGVDLIGEKRIKTKKLDYPADFISEAVDQTRGWFYTMLAVATLLGKGNPYRNVISLGHLLDKNGQKMSKSKGNVVNPWEIIEKYGSDTLRWYFYTVNSPGEAKNFNEKDIFNKLRGFILTFWNSYIFFDTYVGKVKRRNITYSNILDKWLSARLEEIKVLVTERIENYDLTSASRAIEDFLLNDFSQWYLRRSRRRFQHPSSTKDFEDAALMSANCLLDLATLLAPFTPFIAETIYQGLARKMTLKEKSVHLRSWPLAKSKKQIQKILLEMKQVREVVAQGLKIRSENGIKIRQPLKSLSINIKLDKKYFALIKDEVNVKEIIKGKNLLLDTQITPELKAEGYVRELVRNIQDLRKDLGLNPKKKIMLLLSASKELDDLFLSKKKFILGEVNAARIIFGTSKKYQASKEIKLGENSARIGISRA